MVYNKVYICALLETTAQGCSTIRPIIYYDASRNSLEAGSAQLTHDDAHPFAPKRLNRNLFYSCVRVATRHSVNPPLGSTNLIAAVCGFVVPGS